MEIKMTKNDFFYLTFIFLLAFLKNIGIEATSIVYQGVFGLLTVFTLLRFIMNEFTKREILNIAILGIILVANYIISSNTALLFSFIICIGAKNIKIKKIIFSILGGMICGLTYLFLGQLIGFVERREIIMWREEDYVIRYSYGDIHPNIIQLTVFLIIIFSLYLYYYKINFVWIIVFFGINYISYTQTVSRTGFYTINFVLLSYIFMKYNSITKKIIMKITPYIQYIITLVIGVLCIFLANTNLFLRLNNLMTGRLYYSMLQFEIGVSLLGNSEKLAKENEILFDISYTYIIYSFGIIAIILLILYYKTAKELVKLKKYNVILLMWGISIYMIGESFYPNALLNITLIFIAKYLYGELKEES